MMLLKPIKSFLRSFLVLVTMIVILGASIAGCRKRPDSDSHNVGNGIHQLSLGAVLALTGPAGTMGGESLNGLRLAVDEINERGKIHISLKIYDTKTDPTEAAKLLQQVASIDKVHAIVGPSTSPSCLRTGRLIQDLGVPAMTPTATNVNVTHVGDCMSRICFIDPFQGEALAKFARQNLKLDSAVLVIDKANDYAVGLANAFRDSFRELGGVIIGEENYSTGDAVFAALISKVSQYNADLLFIPGWYSDVGPMLKQAGRQWDKFVLLGGDAWDSPQLFELSGGNIRNAYISTFYAADDPAPLVQTFVNNYKARFKKNPGGYAALGYDVGQAMEDAAIRAGKISRKTMKNAINSIKNLHGVTGTTTLNATRDAEKPATIVEVLPNGYRFVTKIGERN